MGDEKVDSEQLHEKQKLMGAYLAGKRGISFSEWYDSVIESGTKEEAGRAASDVNTLVIPQPSADLLGKCPKCK